MGQPRRLSDIGMSASPPTTDVSLDAANRRFGPKRRHRNRCWLCLVTDILIDNAPKEA